MAISPTGDAATLANFQQLESSLEVVNLADLQTRRLCHFEAQPLSCSNWIATEWFTCLNASNVKWIESFGAHGGLRSSSRRTKLVPHLQPHTFPIKSGRVMISFERKPMHIDEMRKSIANLFECFLPDSCILFQTFDFINFINFPLPHSNGQTSSCNPSEPCHLTWEALS